MPKWVKIALTVVCYVLAAWNLPHWLAAMFICWNEGN